MNIKEKKKAAQEFAEDWSGEFKEDGKTAPFWLDLLHRIYGITDPQYIQFEKTVKHDAKGNALYLDAYIPSAKVIIEQKATKVSLDQPYTRHKIRYQSVYEQAAEYDQTMGSDERAKYIIACNFHEFWIYDMSLPEKDRKAQVIKLELKDLPKHLETLDFLADQGKKPEYHNEVEVSVQAGSLVGKLYDAFYTTYAQFGELSAKDYHDINVVCVRIVFCLYAEDSGLFEEPEQFCHYLESWKPENAREALKKLFEVLDQPVEQRDRFLEAKLKAFPYVNGGLFREGTGPDKKVEVPPISEETYHIIVDDMSKGFDWSRISPTIFGAVFESTLNPETRRSGGMHYTSVENIHKVIDPLFLDDLKKKYESIVGVPDSKKYRRNRNTKEILMTADYRKKLESFQDELAGLSFLDPACGSGNFLTETYISLRKLENGILREQTKVGGAFLDFQEEQYIKVSISHFYGIEINDFAVTVAKAALWIAENQMMQETEDIIHQNLNFLPLKTGAKIVEANALRIDWEEVVPKDELNYIIGNPPFVGARLMAKDGSKKDDMIYVFSKKIKGLGNLDYVTAWYKKAAEYILNTKIECAYVSTNSITQGIQPPILWKSLKKYNIHINFAYRTFIWNSESNDEAAVHCVIIGFSNSLAIRSKIIYGENAIKNTQIKNINAYLLDAPNVLIESRSTPICNMPKIIFGSMPNDNKGKLSKYTTEEKESIIKKYPKAKKMFKRFLGAEEFINGKDRWCLWLVQIPLHDIRTTPPIYEAVKSVKIARASSTRAETKKLADTPGLFGEIRQPDSNYLIIPRHSSQNREYIPFAFEGPDIICGDSNAMLPNATLYIFGVLESKVHMAWMRVVAGRIKSDYRYSNDVVYNNFPWPDPTPQQKERIEKSAQAILDAREKYSDSSLADLYDPDSSYLYPELKKAHEANDQNVMAAYGFTSTMEESDIVAELMKMYQKLTEIKQ